jgi:hypothetical protein
MSKVIVTILILISFCCRQPSPPGTKASFKDSMVKRHLALIGPTEFYDTLNYDYKILSAYMNNDSAFFIRMNKDMNRAEQYTKEEPRLDTCVHLTKLSDLLVDEAYRFWHGQSFCDYGQRITITRSGVLIQLHYVEYSNGDGKTQYLIANGDPVIVQPYCTVLKEFLKDLSIKDWEELEKRVDKADYWGLKQYHHKLMFDGSHWQIDAYTKRPKYGNDQKIHSVSRQSPSSDAFREIGIY